MTSTASETRLFIAPGGNGQTRDGSALHPYSTLSEALGSLPTHHSAATAAPGTLGSTHKIEILALPTAGANVASPAEPAYQFTVDPMADESHGTPTAAPRSWPDLPTAIAEVDKLHQSGAVQLTAGQSLRLSVRQAFASTPSDRRRQRRENIARFVFFAMTMMLAIPLAAILGYLFYKAWPVLSWSFIFENPRNNMTAGGIWAPLVGTFYLVFCSLLVAAPIGVLAGVYLHEYAGQNWFTRIVNLAVVNLAGVPSIVHALFGVGAFVMFARLGESVLAASCTLAIMTLPVIVASTREALSSVPRSFREACWNMGASRWQTIRTIVLPNAMSGILTGVILQVSRAAGETAPILFTGAAFFVNVPDHGIGYFFPYTLDDTCMALSYHLYTVLTQVKGASAAQIAAGKAIPLEHLQYGTAVVLIGMVLLLNSMAITFRVYLRSRKKW